MKQTVWVLAAALSAIPGFAAADPHKLVPCGESDFTVTRFFDTLPVDLSTVSGLVPLGNANGSSHILPISTTYFYTAFAFGGADGNQMVPALTDEPIRVPGDVIITGIRWEPNSGGSLFAGDDWYVDFRPCAEIRFTYHHLNAITGPPKLVARAAQIRKGIKSWCTYDDAGNATSCSGVADVKVDSGTVVGAVYRLNQVSFNFTAFDTRDATTAPAPPPGAAVDPSRYELTLEQLLAALAASGQPIPKALDPELYAELDPSRTHARCALDYFEPAARAALYAKLGSFDGSVPRTVAPLCGQVFQDSTDGALGGGWFPEGLTMPFLLAGEDVLAAFLRGNVDPAALFFSIGQSVAPSLGRTLSFPYPGFDPPGGTHNISFDGARYHPELPSQPLFCWDGLVAASMEGGATVLPTPVPGTVLVQFSSAARIQLEYAPAGNCVSPAFSAAAGFFVR